MLTLSKGSYLRYGERVSKFLYSYYYLIILLILGALGFIFEQERLAMGILIILLCYNLITFKDMLPNFAVIVILAMIPLGRYAQDKYFYPLTYLIPLIILAFVIHIILFPPKIRNPRYLMPLIAVALSITLGGLFSPNLLDGLKLHALYHIAFLGAGMVIFYLLFEAYIEKGNPETIRYFSKIMVIVGVMGIIMITARYIKFYELFAEPTGQNIVLINRNFQFRNNLTNNLLISMPFAFYLAVKSRYTYIYFVIGCLQYLAMVFSLSRGGIIFATMMIPILIISTIWFVKDNRKRLILLAILLIVGVILALLALFPLRDMVEYALSRIKISSNEARANLYRLAWDNFLRYPIFGRGLGYNGGMYYYPQAWSIYWYHSTLFQILGSLGIMGVIAYSYYYFVRLRVIFRLRNFFNAYVLMAFIGFEAYSLVNVGNFVPFPFVFITIVLFIIADRYNGICIFKPDAFLDERIVVKGVNS